MNYRDADAFCPTTDILELSQTDKQIKGKLKLFLIVNDTKYNTKLLNLI